MPGVEFGVFAFETERLELTKSGLPVKLGPQPARVLKLLLDSPGEVVSRETIREALWPAGTHVEFETGLNTAVNRLRRVLNDSADQPRYIETLPRTGYRFIAPVEKRELAVIAVIAEAPPPPAPLTEPASRPSWKPRAWMAVCALLLVVAIYAAVRMRTPAPAQRLELAVDLPPGAAIVELAVSPLGDHVAYIQVAGGAYAVYRRFFNETFSRRVAGADGAMRLAFSPDGQQLAVATRGELRIVNPDGGTRDLLPLRPADSTDTLRWDADGFVYYSLGPGDSAGIWRILAAGDKPAERILEPVTKPNGVEYRMLHGRADGALLFTGRTGPRHNDLWIRTAAGKERTLHSPAKGGFYGAGMLVYEDRDQLVAEAFDAQTGEPANTRIVLAKDVEVRRGWAGPMVAMNASGVVAFVRDRVRDRRRIVWVERGDGAVSEAGFPIGEYEQVRISPRDPNMATVAERTGQESWVLRLADLGAKSSRTILTGTEPIRAAWMPDGKSLIVNSNKDNGDFVNLYLLEFDAGKPEEAKMRRLTEQPLYGQFPSAVSPDGKEVLFQEGVHPVKRSDIKAYSFRDGKVRSVVSTNGWDLEGVFDAEGRRIAYGSDEDGKLGVFIASGSGAKRVADGRGPLFADGGKRIVYGLNGLLMETAADGSGQARGILAGAASVYDVWTRPYDMAPGATRVLTIMRAQPEGRRRVIEVIRDVAAEFRAK